MKALVKYGQRDGEVELRDVPVPAIGPNDVLFEVKAAAICGWDIEMWRHSMANPVTVPVVQGHEFAGVVHAAGGHVTSFAEGDRVVSETAAVICGRCPQCRRGDYNLCPGRKGFGYGVDGAFTDFVCVPERCLHRIPGGVSFEHACLTEPACVAYHAMAVQSKILPGQPMLIIGPGPVGLLCLQIAKACGAGTVMITGTSADICRLEAARKLGADVVINGSLQDAGRAVVEKTGGEGMPLVIDAAGNEKALALALDAVARGGQITKIGWGPRPVNLSLDPLLRKAACLQGTFSHTWTTWEYVLAMISRESLQMEPMLSHRISLEQWREAFELVENRQAIKAIFLFNRE